jgi:hypothetical protein
VSGKVPDTVIVTDYFLVAASQLKSLTVVVGSGVVYTISWLVTPVGPVIAYDGL